MEKQNEIACLSKSRGKDHKMKSEIPLHQRRERLKLEWDHYQRYRTNW